MAIFKEDIVDIDLETGKIYRSFLSHTIGHKDTNADRFGVRVFRAGAAESLSGVQCQAIFMAPDGQNIALTSHGTVSGNVAYVTLPQACYNVEGQFCLAIKLVGGGITGTVRIIDGMVDRTGATGAVAPTAAVPTYQEILAVYAEMQEDIADYESVVANQNDQINSIKSALLAEIVPLEWTNTLVKGEAIGTSSGKKTSSNAAIRSNLLYGWPSLVAVNLSNLTYEYRLFRYGQGANLTTGAGYIDCTAYSTGLQIIPEKSTSFAIVVKRADGTNVTDADVAAVSAALTKYTTTDNTLTMTGKPADAKATGDTIKNLSETVEKTFVDTIGSLVFEQGNIDSDTGEYTESTGRVRTKAASGFRCSGIYNNRVYFNVDSSLKIRYMEFSGVPATTSNYTGHYGEFVTGEGYWTLEDGKYYQFVVVKANGASLAPEDIGENDIIISWYRNTDRTLSKVYEPADALACGNAVNALISQNNILFPKAKKTQFNLEAYTISFSTGARSASANNRYCSTGFMNYNTDLVLVLNLPEYEWHAWSYKGQSSGNATHSDTNSKVINGNTPIFIKKNIQDHYYNVEFRRADGNVLTTDASDPNSDYSKIANALKVFTAGKLPGEYTNGYIFRMQANPNPVPVDDNALGYNEFIEQTWETIRSDYSNFVSRSVVGTSSTTATIGTEYNIYQYVFTPENYETTVFLSAGCHGNEYEGFWGLYRVMRMIYDYGYKYPNLRKLRDKVRFVIVPVWNPWGVQNRERNCPLGFPTQENLNASVSVDGTTYPAFTSKECQAIKAVFDAYDGELSLWVDIHTDPYSVTHTWKKGLYGYAAESSAINRVLYSLTVSFRQIIRDEVNYRSNFTIYNTATTSDSGIPGYGFGRGVPSAVIETTVNEFAESGSAEQMKYAQEWYGNVIAEMIQVT